MNITLLNALIGLFGQGDYQHMGRRFRRGGGGLEPVEIALLVGGIVAVVAVAVLINRFVAKRQGEGFESKSGLFAELCRGHRISWTERRILKRLAAHHQLAPCQLFLDPARFQPDQIPDDLARYAAHIKALRGHLFSSQE